MSGNRLGSEFRLDDGPRFGLKRDDCLLRDYRYYRAAGADTKTVTIALVLI